MHGHDAARPARHTRAPRGGRAAAPERGSVTPLVIGMVVCLLVLGAGVTAATSGFLARADLQHVCDGAASAAADAAQRARLTTPGPLTDTGAAAVAVDYLGARHARASVQAELADEAVLLTCQTESPITFGAMFGVPTATVTVHAVGRTVLTPVDS